MKKVGYGIAVVAVVGAYVAATAYSGHKVQQESEASLAKMAAAMPFLKVVDQKYEKGFFSATQSFGLQFGCDPQEGDKAQVLRVHSHIAHGPFPGFSSIGAARIDTRIEVPQSAPEGLRNWVGQMKPQDIRTLVGFGGGVRTDMVLPAGDFAEDSGQVQWQKLQFRSEVNGARTETNYEFSLPEMRVKIGPQDEQVTVKMTNLRSQGQGSIVGGLFFGVGKSGSTIDSLDIETSKDMSFQFQQMKYFSESSESKDFIDAKVGLSANALMKFGKDVPDLKLDKIELAESVKHLHAPTLKEVAQKFMDEFVSCKNDFGDAMVMQEKLEELTSDLRKLVAFDPEYSVDKIAVQYDGHEGSVGYSIAAKGITAEEIEQQDIPAMIGKALVKVNAKLPLPWLDQLVARGGERGKEARAQIDAMLQSLVDQGYVVRDNAFVSSSMVFENGEAKINGKPFDPSGLMH